MKNILKMNGKELDEAFGKTVLSMFVFLYALVFPLGIYQFAQIVQWVYLNVSIVVK